MDEEVSAPEGGSSSTREVRVGAGSLRTKTARGTIVNGLFLSGVQALSLLRGFAVAAFLTREEYGVWGIVLMLYLTVWTVRQVGVGERFVQQDADDTVRSFQMAFTVDVAVGAVFLVLGVPVVFACAAIYGLPEVVAPGLLILLVLPLQSLQMPLAIFYRRMDFARQRALQAADPITAFVVTMALAIDGAGYWSLVIGTVAGALVGAVVAVVASPYPLRFVLERAALPGYFGFSWPILVAGMSGIVTGQGLIIIGNAELGLAGVGVISLCAVVSQVADRASRAITDTMFPAICAVKDRADLLHESFVTSNRLALMWGIPFGVGVALFAEDLLVRVFGAEWGIGVDLLRATALALAIQQIAFNWHAYYRARGETRPMAIAGIAGVVIFLALVTPLMIAEGLDGLALAVLLAAPLNVALRFHFLRRIFPTLDIARHVARGLLPSLLPVATVLGLRAATTTDRDLLTAGGEVVLYVALTIACTWALERDLLREARGYLRGSVAAA